MAHRDTSTPPKSRNWAAAANPLLRKGGVHQKSRKAERKLAKDSLRRNVRRSVDSPVSMSVL